MTGAYETHTGKAATGRAARRGKAAQGSPRTPPATSTTSAPRALTDADIGPKIAPIAALAGAQALEATGALPSLALAATVLWARFLRFDPNEPNWPDRDRVVISSTRLRAITAALERLSGQATITSMPSGVPGGPVVDVAGAPSGQGLAAGVGLALAERQLVRWFGRSLVKHRTWILGSETDLMTGAALEAAAIAGELPLDRLTVLVDVSGCADDIAVPTRLSLSRFAASGWSVRRVDSHDQTAITAALNAALRSRKPSLIACQHGHTPAAAAQTACGMPALTAATVATQGHGDETALWAITARRGGAARRSWTHRLARHRLRDDFERVQAGARPALWHEDWRHAWLSSPTFNRPGLDPASGLQGGRFGLGTLGQLLPELLGLYASRGVPIMHEAVLPGAVDCGTQDHGMAAILNGIASHGGLLAVGATAFVAVDRMRPALRLAALLRRQVVHLLLDTGIAPGEEGTFWQPVEQLASLRAMPNMRVFRPANAFEVMHCLELALERRDGPTLVALGETRPETGAIGMSDTTSRTRASGCVRGGYIVTDAEGGTRHATLIASGAEVGLALAARMRLLAWGIDTAVVSLPCWELFAAQSPAYRAAVMGDAPRVGIEAAAGFGWERWLGDTGVFIGMDEFGTSAPNSERYRQFGITPGAICARVREFLSAPGAVPGGAGTEDGPVTRCD